MVVARGKRLRGGVWEKWVKELKWYKLPVMK